MEKMPNSFSWRLSCFSGKKFWTWGPNEVGRRWDKKLTDNDGPYFELMMGAYSDNQPDYSFIHPMSTKRGTMYFYGIKNMDSIKEANTNFAVNLELENNKAVIQINATRVNKDLTVMLTVKGQTQLKKMIAIDPAKPYSKEVSLADDVKYEDMKIQLFSAEDEELISWQPAPKKNEPHPVTSKEPVDPKDYKIDDELWLAGLRLEQFGNAEFDPLKYYAEALERDSTDVLVNTQLGLNNRKRE